PGLGHGAPGPRSGPPQPPAHHLPAPVARPVVAVTPPEHRERPAYWRAQTGGPVASPRLGGVRGYSPARPAWAPALCRLRPSHHLSPEAAVMSGIVGLLTRDGQPVQHTQLQAMLAALAHRGPDGAGWWHEGPAGLGHQMLRTTPEALLERLP